MKNQIRFATAALLLAAVVACEEDLTSTEELAPRRELVAAASAPTTPAGNRAQCYTSADGLTVSPNCPVLKWNNVTYWILEYEDGRNSLNLVAYDPDNNILNQSERTGTRQLYDIIVNANAQTVTLFGKDAVPAIVPWSVLEASQDDGD